MGSQIQVSRSGGIAWVILSNESHRNAMTWDMWQMLPVVLKELDEEPTVKVIALQGKGGHFCSGADISEFDQRRNSLEQSISYQQLVDQANTTLAGMVKPTVALIRGSCYGGGVGLAIHTDIRYASAESRFSIPAAKLGVSYEYMSIEKLVDLIGPAWASELFYTALPFSAEQALMRGLVNNVFSQESFDEITSDLLYRIATNAPLTLKSIKANIALTRKRSLAEDELTGIKDQFAACFASADYIEGRNAFREKRKPLFKGC